MTNIAISAMDQTLQIAKVKKLNKNSISELNGILKNGFSRGNPMIKEKMFLDKDLIINRLNYCQTDRFESLINLFPKVVAKRLNALDITKGAIGHAVDLTQVQNPNIITVLEPNGKNWKDLSFDFTDGYNELKAFFNGLKGINNKQMKTIKEELPKILSKQGWIKPE